jgi:CheY-like chemotaxis protein
MVTRSPEVDNKVLVIEDNLINQKVIRLLLGELGLEVEIASTGKEGLTALDQHSYAAIFVDIGLPDISGLEVITQLRQRRDTKAKLPVIVISADGTLRDELSYKQRGIDAYLVKPLTLAQLRETLAPYFSYLILA